MALLDADSTETRNGQSGWEKFLARYGLPTFLLLLVGYYFIWPTWDRQVEATPRIESKLDAHIQATRDADKLHREHERRLEYLLWITACLNTKTTAAQQACSSVR